VKKCRQGGDRFLFQAPHELSWDIWECLLYDYQKWLYLFVHLQPEMFNILVRIRVEGVLFRCPNLIF
jgi:hypothetical protein